MCDYKTVYYYNEKGNETSFYEIIEYHNKNKHKYRVSFPLDHSVYQYVTYFDDYFDAYDYVRKQQFKTQECL